MNFEQLNQTVSKFVKEIAESYEVTGFRYHVGELDRQQASAPDFDDSSWSLLSDVTIQRGQGIVWLRLQYVVPETVHGVNIEGTQLRVAGKKGGFSVPVEFYIDGVCVLSETAWMDFKCPEAIITQSAVPGTVHTIAIRMDMLEKCFWSNAVEMVVIPHKVEDLAFEISSIGEELMYIAPLESAKELLPAAFDTVQRIFEQQSNLEEIAQSIREVRRTLAPVAEETKKKTVHLIGHAHIDMNWFWSMEETRQVVARDFDTMTKLLEEYPEFKFSQSQCAVYEIAQQDCPEVFERVQKFNKEGHWDCTASTWVEGDMNMADGESVNRHMLYSKKYLAENGLQEPRIMWCPDTFGHSANTPQMLLEGGVPYYYHMRCPHGIDNDPAAAVSYMTEAHHIPLYWWKGLDGSRVLTTSMLYNAEVWPYSILRLSAAMRDRYGISRAMYVYGTGDHGGGPTKRDIEKIRKMNTYPTMPNLFFSTTGEFYDAVQKEDLSRLPEVEGELNFIYDGCYTTHADIKRDNRQCENLLDATERLCVLAALQGYSYPGERFEKFWHNTLFNQFHDIFDGSGIPDTYECSREMADEVLNGLKEIGDDALAFLGSHMQTDRDKGLPFLVFNPASFERSESVLLHLGKAFSHAAAVDGQGNALECQVCNQGVLVRIPQMPAMGCAVVYLKEAEENADTTFTLTEDENYYYVESDFYQVELKKASGEITTLYDKVNKHFVARRMDLGWRMQHGILNTLQVHHEVPGEMSGWLIHDVARIDRLIFGAESRILEDGALRKVIEFVHHFGDSVITQQVQIEKSSARIDFSTHVTWGEYGDFTRLAPMLRVVHTPNLDNHDAVYDIACGTVRRPLKDEEYPALKWVAADGSEYGFAVLNDCKHGYKVLGGKIELCLIRSGWTPDPKSDVGEHQFTYSILPYKGSYQDAGVVEQGYFLNRPVMSCELEETAGDLSCDSLLSTEAKGVVVTSVKKAEKEDAVIVRIVDVLGLGSEGELRLGFRATAAECCNTLEQTLGAADCSDNSVRFALKPFEQKSFKIYPVKK